MTEGECESAAYVMGLSDVTAYVFNNTNLSNMRPRGGCAAAVWQLCSGDCAAA
eukprot:gene46394-24196_t